MTDILLTVLNDQAAPPARTVCHGCRGAGYASVPNHIGVMVMRPVLIAGEGEVIGAVCMQQGGEATIGRPCRDCATTDDPGWLPGFVGPA